MIQSRVRNCEALPLFQSVLRSSSEILVPGTLAEFPQEFTFNHSEYVSYPSNVSKRAQKLLKNKQAVDCNSS